MNDLVTDEDRWRLSLYRLLGTLLASPPSDSFLLSLSGIEGDDSRLGLAIGTLKSLAQKMTGSDISREFNALFIGVGRGELFPYASYYLTGFLNEKPLARLRSDMRAIGAERVATVSEPEDGIASLADLMAGLIDGTFGRHSSLHDQNKVFSDHIEPWAEHFFSDLEVADSAVFYGPVGTIGKLFMNIERDAFRMLAPQKVG